MICIVQAHHHLFARVVSCLQSGYLPLASGIQRLCRFMFVLWRVFIQSTSCKIMSNQTTLSGFPMNGSNFAKGTSPTKKPPTASSRALQASWKIFAEGIPKMRGHGWAYPGLSPMVQSWMQMWSLTISSNKTISVAPNVLQRHRSCICKCRCSIRNLQTKSIHRKECASLHAKHQRTSLVFCLWDLKVHILRTYFVVVPTFSSHK